MRPDVAGHASGVASRAETREMFLEYGLGFVAPQHSAAR